MRDIVCWRQHHRAQKSLTLAVLAIAWSTASFGQEAPFNASEVGRFDQSGQSYADVWGDGDFGYIGHFGQRVVDIIDLTDPANPVLAATYDSAVVGASAQDVKVADGLMFVGLEGVTPGCQIVDVRDPYAPVKLTDVTVLPQVHNMFYDEGWLYLVDSSNAQIDIVDLRTYDPNSPPATISTRRWRMTGVGGQFVHDITVQDGRMYVSAWDTLRVYDVSDVANTIPTLLGTASGDNVHAAWATDDGRFVVAGEEKNYSGMTLYEVIEGGGSVTLEARDYQFLSVLRAGSVHNVVIDGYRVYISWYAAGVQVLEIDPDTATWQLVASFDTTAANGTNSHPYTGNWGVYPLHSPAQVLASDRDNGLFVLDIDPNVLIFRYPSGLPTTIEPDVATPIEIEIDAIGAPINTPTVMRHASINGGPPASQTLTDEGSGRFSGTLPPAECGRVVELSFSAENFFGTSFEDSSSAPGEPYQIEVATGTVSIFEDDFDADFGWTVTNSGVSSGGWVRGDPRGTGAQPEFDGTGALDGSCFFTGQGGVGGDLGDADLDGGPTVLTSPELDVGGAGALVSFSFWFFNHNEDGDRLVVEVSNNGVDWVEARSYEALLGGWYDDRFHTADFVAPTSETQVRFAVADSGSSSILEAAVDNFRVETILCNVPFFADGFESGDTTRWSSTTP